MREYKAKLDISKNKNNKDLDYYISDANTSDFYVKITKAGKSVDMTDWECMVLASSPSGLTCMQYGVITYNDDVCQVYIDLESYMKNEVGKWTCQLVFEKDDEILVLDAITYVVTTDLMLRVDEAVSEDERIPILRDLIAKCNAIISEEELRVLAEQLRVEAENNRQANEQARIAEEQIRDANEQQRENAELDRQEQEYIRQANEVQRNEEESNRQANEVNRQNNETDRQDTFSNLVDNFNDYSSDVDVAEQQRIINEQARQQAEQIRVAQENERLANELQREEVEAERVANENKRVQSENNRVANEQSRVNAENTRANTFNNLQSSFTQLNQQLVNAENERKVNEQARQANEDNRAANENIRQEQEAIRQANEVIRQEEHKQVEGKIANIEAEQVVQNEQIKQHQKAIATHNVLVNAMYSENVDGRITLTENNTNYVELVQARDGLLTQNEFSGSTMVNVNLDSSKEVVLNKEFEVEGDNKVVIEGTYDNGLANVLIEGETLVNVCDQEEPIAITKSYTVENTNHVPLQGEYDGKCRPVVEGNTLVNLCINTYDISGTAANSNLTTEEKIDNGFSVSTEEYASLVICNHLAYTLKDNTVYTAIFDLNTTYHIEDNNATLLCSFKGTNEGTTSYAQGAVPLLGDYSTGYTRIITTITTTTECDFLVIGNHTNLQSGSLSIKNVMLFEGDLTANPPSGYIEGLKSSFEDGLVTDENDENYGKYKVEYNVVGKNKFDCESVFEGDIVEFTNQDGKPLLYKGTTYTLSSDCTIDDNGNSPGIRFLDKNDFGIHSAYLNNNYTFTASDDVYTIYLYSVGLVYASSLNSIRTFRNIQIEEGTQATEYEPYKSSTKTLYLNSPLLEGDTIEEINGKATHVHRYHMLVLDGSEDWSSQSINLDSCHGVFFTLEKPGKTQLGIKSDRFVTALAGVDGTTLDAISLNADKRNLLINVSHSKLSEASLNGFKQWLQKNPTTVVYELATPTYETISSSDTIIDSYANGHLNYNTIVPISSTKFVAYSKEMVYLNTSTSYTIQFNSDSIGTVDITLGGNKVEDKGVVQGLNQIEIATPSTLADNMLIIEGDNVGISELIVTPLNSANPIYGYFKGIQSSFENGEVEIVTYNAPIRFGKGGRL